MPGLLFGLFRGKTRNNRIEAKKKLGVAAEKIRLCNVANCTACVFRICMIEKRTG